MVGKSPPAAQNRRVRPSLPSRPELSAVVAVTAPGAVLLSLGLWRLDRGGMWRDEAVTFEVARRSVPQIWRLLHEVDAVHGLYYLFMHAVLAVRADETVLRLPSVVGAAVAACLAGALGTRLARPRVGLWAGLLYAATPMTGHYAQEGRSYALVAAGALGATLLLVRALDGRSWAAYGLVLAVTCLLHELAVLLVLAHALTLSLARVRRRAWVSWGRAVAAALLVLTPLVVVSARQSAQVGWLAVPDWDSADHLLRAFLGPYDAVYWTCLVLGLLALPGRRRLSVAAVAAPLLLVPPVTLLLVSQMRPLYDPRYVLYALAGAPLLVAAGADRVLRAGRRLLSLGVALPRVSPPALRGIAALCGALLVALGFVHQLPLHRHERTVLARADDLALISAEVSRVVRAGEPMVFLPAAGRRSAVAYPEGFSRARDVALREPGPPSGTLYGTEAAPEEVRRRLRGADRLWVLAEGCALTPLWRTKSPAERLKLAVVQREFTPAVPRRQFVRYGVTLRLYVRKAAGEGETAGEGEAVSAGETVGAYGAPSGRAPGSAP